MIHKNRSQHFYCCIRDINLLCQVAIQVFKHALFLSYLIANTLCSISSEHFASEKDMNMVVYKKSGELQKNTHKPTLVLKVFSLIYIFMMF